MPMKRLVIALVAGAFGSAVAQTLPPDHPPVGAPSPAQPGGAQPAPGALPPGHPPLAPAAPQQPALPAAPPEGSRSPEELIAELDRAEGLVGREKSFQVAVSLGKLYQGNGRFAEAVTFLRQAVEKGEPVRTLFLAQSKRAKAKRLDLPTPQEAGCAPDPNQALEAQLAHAQSKAKANDPGAAATCARLALEPVLEARKVLAGALMNSGDPAEALKVLEGSLEASPDHADSLWAHAALLLETNGDDVAALRQAKAEWERYLTLRPGAPRAEWTKKLIARAEEAIAAGGLTRLDAQRTAEVRARAAAGASASGQPPHPPVASAGPGMLGPVSPEAMEAIQNTERTPELIAGLAKLVEEAEEHLARGRFQEALDNYKRVVPFEPNNGRAKAGMAWSLVGLNRGPMAENVWRVAVGADPASVDALGDTLQKKGDAAGARSLWTKLAQTDPAYAERSGLKARLEKR